jgi:hypothetical protein
VFDSFCGTQNRSNPLLVGLTGPGEVSGHLDTLQADMALFKTLSSGVYMGFNVSDATDP